MTSSTSSTSPRCARQVVVCRATPCSLRRARRAARLPCSCAPLHLAHSPQRRIGRALAHRAHRPAAARSSRGVDASVEPSPSRVARLTCRASTSRRPGSLLLSCARSASSRASARGPTPSRASLSSGGSICWAPPPCSNPPCPSSSAARLARRPPSAARCSSPGERPESSAVTAAAVLLCSRRAVQPPCFCAAAVMCSRRDVQPPCCGLRCGAQTWALGCNPDVIVRASGASCGRHTHRNTPLAASDASCGCCA